ncbi:hypothetical protein GRF59_14920 [Paenibacillus sp. HJL G12]|uniref:Uncharacterized protein n=1 Tax=Paenibacillus dendrobii TaxID=2691084 RepID=A0A7X3IMQ5_9BACL|nr:hypothetical protein [Paenibacillus dendrobii]MWV44912.1 hypothetical protein [Paenibacillus dendrobii]
MWKEYRDRETVGYVKMINEDYSKYQENAEVILLDTFKEGEKLLSRKVIRFTEYFGSDPEEGMSELKEDFKQHYGKEPESLLDIAYYCADGWSRWSTDERIDNPSEEVIHGYFKKHRIDS